MDPRIVKIADRLLDDCLQEPAPSAKAELKRFNYPHLSEKDLLQITGNFLEYLYPKQTRTSVTDAAPGEEKVSY